MTALHLIPSSPAEQMILGLVLAGFACFAVTLMWVSTSVTLAQRAARSTRGRERSVNTGPVSPANA